MNHARLRFVRWAMDRKKMTLVSFHAGDLKGIITTGLHLQI